MTTTINNKEHRIVYIEYDHHGLPFNVKTIFYVDKATNGPYWRIVDWDFFANNGDARDMRAYNCGSGGSHKEIQAPHWAPGHIGKYWLADDAKFKGKPINGKRLKQPRRLSGYYMSKFKTSINPFECAEITHNHEHCEMCGHSSTEFCDTHKYTDKNGDDRWKHNNKHC